MILSDVDIRKQLASGRVVIDPIADDAIQPSSIDLRVGDQFRVFANSRYPYIDVKQPMDDLTELVKATEDEPFILHPGEFVLGSTLEVVTLPDDLVARLEGKSSLGRLGLLIHSSLPADEEVLFCEHGSTPRMTPIGLIVKEQRRGSVVSFDPETFEVEHQDVTGWYEGPPDRVYEIRLESGRSVRVSGGHNLFTIDRHGELQKVRTLELTPGTKVAIPRRLPEPTRPSRSVDLLDLVPESAYDEVVCQGPGITDLFRRWDEDVAASLRASGRKHVAYYRARARLPLSVLRQIAEAAEEWRGGVEVGFRGSSHTMPAVVAFDADTAWLLGLYVAEGYRRRGQIVLANTDEAVLDRVELILRRWVGTEVYRSEHHVTCSSTLFSSFMSWIGADGHARDKRIPWIVHGWPSDLVEAFLEGFVDGDGSRESTRTSLWSGSEALVDGFLALLPRLGLRASASRRDRDSGPAFQISIPHREHKLLTGVPLPDRLLVDLRVESGLSQKDAARAAGYRRPTDLCNIEKRTGRDAVRLRTLRRLRKVYGPTSTRLGKRLDRLIDGGLLWDRVAEVRVLPDLEPVFDLEVRPGRRHIENFVAGSGIFVSNTAGFVDAGWSGNLTLELSNVANLPITIYPGMKIGQLCLFQMTTPAENPYGSKRVGSKYHGQEGPTPSRYYKNFP